MAAFSVHKYMAELNAVEKNLLFRGQLGLSNERDIRRVHVSTEILYGNFLPSDALLS
jgi:hypothetical protein